MLSQITLALILLAAIAVAYFRARRSTQSDTAAAAWRRRENLPPLLKGSALVASEANLRISVPIALHGTLDQLYRARNGDLVMVDTKRRVKPRVYERDILQVSTFAMMVANGGLPGVIGSVSRKGYIRFALRSGEIQYVEIDLMSPAKILEYYERYWELRTLSAPDLLVRPSPALCGNCKRRLRCPESRAKDFALQQHSPLLE
ncbi:MAG: hypothetical protein E6Q76_07340 [Rhizobium sp.]|nr:MAG: hypothetical protein E6Q76_07340 [Rhizobium sp.]